MKTHLGGGVKDIKLKIFILLLIGLAQFKNASANCFHYALFYPTMNNVATICDNSTVDLYADVCANYAQAADNEVETHDYDFLIKSDDDSSIKNFIVYPNPSDGIFNIDLGNENIGTKSIKMYNSMGQQVEMTSSKINAQIITLDFSNVPKGLFTVEILEGVKVIGRSKLSIVE